MFGFGASKVPVRLALGGPVLLWLVAALACGKGATPPAPAGDAAASSSSPAASAPAQKPPEPPPPPPPTPEELLRAELATWNDVPYFPNGKTRRGIGNSGFVSAVFHGAFGLDIPSEYNDQKTTGKLVERAKLEAGDIVFFESGYAPFQTRYVGLYVANDEVAIATKQLGTGTVKLSDPKWKNIYKTARHIIRDPSVGTPSFDASKYGSNRAELLHDIAKAWLGTVYKAGGKTFDNIDNDEFVRNVYEAINDTELEGKAVQWEKMGDAVKKDALEPGDIIFYSAPGFGGAFGDKDVGMFIGGGEFVHAMKGSAVTISKLDEPRWVQSYKFARRLDPIVLTRIQETRAAEEAKRAEAAKPHAAEAPDKATAEVKSAPPPKGKPPAKGSKAATTTKNRPVASPEPPSAAESESTRPRTEDERRLRDAVKPWLGTPYKWGGTTKSGVDCSGFTQAVYLATYEVQIPRVVQDQEKFGVRVKRSELEVGDLVFFRTQGMGPFFRSWHVGIYVGGGEFAQSSGSHGVVISRLDNYYWNKKYVDARRLPKKRS